MHSVRVESSTLIVEPRGERPEWARLVKARAALPVAIASFAGASTLFVIGGRSGGFDAWPNPVLWTYGLPVVGAAVALMLFAPCLLRGQANLVAARHGLGEVAARSVGSVRGKDGTPTPATVLWCAAGVLAATGAGGRVVAELRWDDIDEARSWPRGWLGQYVLLKPRDAEALVVFTSNRRSLHALAGEN